MGKTLCRKEISIAYIKNRIVAYILTHNAGWGKPFFMKVMYLVLTKVLSYENVSADKSKVLLMAPTGDGANVGGTTICTALTIPVGKFRKNLPSLTDKMKWSLRNRLSDLKVIIIDEILVESNHLLFHIHLRFNKKCGFV